MYSMPHREGQAELGTASVAVTYSSFQGRPKSIEHQVTPPPDGLVSLMGRLTAFASNTMMASVEDGKVPGFRQLNTGNSG